MITIEQVKELKHGDYLIELANGARWKVNGQIKYWKREPNRFKIPVKHGLYNHAYIDETVADLLEVAK